MSDDVKQMSVALPGEWVLKKAFGPALTEIGEDMKKLYAKGRDKLVAAAYRKINDPEDGKQANLRVTRDVLWNGAFTEDEVCAEYFGGILASSRSADGKDDDAIQYVDVIKSLSAKQLRLHYVLYNRMNKMLVEAAQPVNVGQGSEFGTKEVWLSAVELMEGLDLRIDTDLNILHRQGLLSQYNLSQHKIDEHRHIPYVMVKPTTFGVLLYATAHNRFGEWRGFDRQDFGDFPNIELPLYFAKSVEDLILKVSVTSPGLQTPSN